MSVIRAQTKNELLIYFRFLLLVAPTSTDVSTNKIYSAGKNRKLIKFYCPRMQVMCNLSIILNQLTKSCNYEFITHEYKLIIHTSHNLLCDPVAYLCSVDTATKIMLRKRLMDDTICIAQAHPNFDIHKIVSLKIFVYHIFDKNFL